MNTTIANLRQSLRDAKKNEQNQKSNGQIITSVLRSVARQTYRQDVRHLSTGDIFCLCENLLQSRDGRESVIAFQWAYQARKRYQSDDFKRFERWLEQYVHSWGSCDDFCTHAFGNLIFKFPEHIPQIKTWTRSANRWFRRGAAVVMIYSIRRGHYFSDSIDIADLLLFDHDDLVQKGYGWMLKEISNKDPDLIFDFVIQRKTNMPRIALRYAIEKMSPERRQQAMEK
jgi:3-methyladenine DNA glycosylase AlkD